MDAIDFEHLFRATTYPNNGTDEPITFFDLIVEARSQMRGQRAMQRGLEVSLVDLYVGKFRDVSGEN